MDHIRDKLVQAAKICVYILLSWQGILTFGFCSLGILLYYRISWIPLQTLLARILVVTLKFWGHSASRIDDTIIMNNVKVHISSICTYISLILAGLPFMWRGDHVARNILRIILFAITVSIINITRLYFTIVMSARGLPWKYSHDYINNLTYIPIVVLVFLLWLRAMRRRYKEQL